jgi:hypothetical protein
MGKSEAVTRRICSSLSLYFSIDLNVGSAAALNGTRNSQCELQIESGSLCDSSAAYLRADKSPVFRYHDKY